MMDGEWRSGSLVINNTKCLHKNTFMYEYVNGNVSEVCRDCWEEIQ